MRSTVGTVKHLVREHWPGFITMATGIPSRLKKGAFLLLASRNQALHRPYTNRHSASFYFMMTVYFRARAAFKVPTEQVLAFSVIKTMAQVKTFHTHSGCCPARTPHRPPPPKQVTMRLG